MIRNKFTVLGEISQRMGKDIILVGGGAVELYTKGWYTTGDLDVITSNRKKLIALLLEMGYERVSERHYLKDEIFIDIVGSYFDRHSDEISIKGTDLKVRVISIEDIIIDRLSACVHWASPKDCEQADYLVSSYFNQLDMDYLMKRANAEQVLDKLEELIRERSLINAKPTHRGKTKSHRKSKARKDIKK